MMEEAVPVAGVAETATVYVPAGVTDGVGAEPQPVTLTKVITANNAISSLSERRCRRVFQATLISPKSTA